MSRQLSTSKPPRYETRRVNNINGMMVCASGRWLLPQVGIGAERYLSKNWGVQLGLNFGLDNSSQKDTIRTVDNNALDLGLKIGANYYFQGKDNAITT